MTMHIRRRQRDCKLDFLASLPQLRGIRRAELVRLGQMVELCEMRPGTAIQVEGEPASQWLSVVDGVALRCRNGIPVGMLTPGSDWGTPLLDPADGHRRRSAEAVVALTPITAVVADARRWPVVAAAYPQLNRREQPAPAPARYVASGSSALSTSRLTPGVFR